MVHKDTDYCDVTYALNLNSVQVALRLFAHRAETLYEPRWKPYGKALATSLRQYVQTATLKHWIGLTASEFSTWSMDSILSHDLLTG